MVQPPDDSPQYGCWFCGEGKGSDLQGTCEECGEPFDVEDDLLSAEIGQFSLIECLGRGFYGYMFHAKSEIGKDVALKVVPDSLYFAQGKDFATEIRRYLDVSGHVNIVELFDAGETNVTLRGESRKVYYLVFPLVRDAEELDEVIENHSPSVDFLLSVARQLCSVIAFLESREPSLSHNDLHGRNILVTRVEPTEYDHAPEVREVLKVIDFGSAIFKGAGPVKPLDDVQWLSTHLSRIRGALLPHVPELDPGQRSFVTGMGRIAGMALESSPGSRPPAEDIWHDIEELVSTSIRQMPWQPPTLGALASYCNALQFPDECYVASLYSDEFPWLRQLLAPDQSLLITGPRGCGKTMILRHADLRTAACRFSEDEPAEDRLKRLSQRQAVGLFVSCRSAFSTYLATGRTPKWMEEPGLVIAYLNLIYLLEAANAFTELQEEGLALLQTEERRAFVNLLRELSSSLLDSPPVERGRLTGGFDDLHSVRLDLLTLCDRIANDEVSVDVVPTLLQTPRPLRRLASFLSTSVESLRGKRVLLLLDDFSQGLLPTTAQQALLPLVFGKFTEYVCWVTAHSMSVPKQDLAGQTYDHNRDYNEIAAGWEYVQTSTQLDVCEDFLQDIFAKRFQLWGKLIGSSLEAILGRSDYGESLAEHIRNLYEDKKLKTLRYHGVDTITRLCTGDISFMIDLVARVVSAADTAFPVPANVQNTHIRAYARVQRLKLRDFFPDGQTLYDIARIFGRMMKHKLVLGPLGSDGRPQEYLRIELARGRELAAPLEELLRHLVQQGVFVVGPGGTSSSEQTTIVLLYRRLFVPAAPASLSDRNKFSWSPLSMEKFLRDPDKQLRIEAAQAGAAGLRLLLEEDEDEFEDVAPG